LLCDAFGPALGRCHRARLRRSPVLKRAAQSNPSCLVTCLARSGRQATPGPEPPCPALSALRPFVRRLVSQSALNPWNAESSPFLPRLLIGLPSCPAHSAPYPHRLRLRSQLALYPGNANASPLCCRPRIGAPETNPGGPACPERRRAARHSRAPPRTRSPQPPAVQEWRVAPDLRFAMAAESPTTPAQLATLGRPRRSLTPPIQTAALRSPAKPPANRSDRLACPVRYVPLI